ncbi:AAA family ATPase [Actinoallomurus sp. NPDC050550]|uniref:AAA family ATPase n=1 Tax=Actinoallomurus sp. NPDC050550 TaxID=3154937 RepID=UPI0033F8F94B
MATAPTVVVAGDAGIGRKLRETRRFPAVFDVTSAKELRHLSRRGEVVPPAAFMFAPGFVEDMPEAGVEILANSLAGNGFTVLVHGYFAERGDSFGPEVQVTDRKLVMSKLLAALGAGDAAPAPEPAPRPRPEPPRRPEPASPAGAVRQATPPAPRTPSHSPSPQPAAQSQVWPPQAQPHTHPQAQAEWASAAGAPRGPSPLAAPPAHGTPPAPPAAPWPISPQAIPAAPPQAVPPAHGTPPAPPAAPWPVSPQAIPAAPLQAVPPQTAWMAPPADRPPAVRGGPPQAVQPQPALAGPPQGVSAPTSNGWIRPQAATGDLPAAATPTVAKRGRVIAVASAKGGVGKTSVIVNLAIHAARILQSVGRAGSVVLVDTNFQQADVARYLNVKSPTVMDLLRTSGGISADTIRNHLARVPQTDLYALLGPPEAINADPSLVNSMQYQRILTVLRKAFDFVFIDTPVAELYHVTFSDLILPEADAVLVPVEPSRVTLEGVQSWLRAITMSRHSRGGGVAPEKLSLLLNRARVDVDCSPEDVMDLLPGWRFAGMIPEDHEWMRTANNHQPIVLHADPELDATLRSILQVLTEDPVFGTAPIGSSANTVANRVKKILGLTFK